MVRGPLKKHVACTGNGNKYLRWLIVIMATVIASTSIKSRFFRSNNLQAVVYQQPTTATKTKPMASKRESRPAEPRPAIAALITNESKDLVDLCYGLESLNVFLTDHSTSPVLVFTEDNLESFQREFLTRCAHPRPAQFPIVDFRSFPAGFDPDEERPSWQKRTKWGYHQMCRFWITTLWKHPAIQEYTTVMRLDSDACYNTPFTDDDDMKLPSMTAGKVYFSNDAYIPDGIRVVNGLWDLAVDYAGRNNLTDRIQFPELWNRARDMWTAQRLLPVFDNNFEVSRVSFMQRPDVAKWHEAVSELEPFGVFRERWGDAPVRYLTMAMFATPDQLVRRKPMGYIHHRASTAPCMEEASSQVTSLYAQLESNSKA